MIQRPPASVRVVADLPEVEGDSSPVRRNLRRADVSGHLADDLDCAGPYAHPASTADAALHIEDQTEQPMAFLVGDPDLPSAPLTARDRGWMHDVVSWDDCQRAGNGQSDALAALVASS
jgi:hypothetical protein